MRALHARLLDHCERGMTLGLALGGGHAGRLDIELSDRDRVSLRLHADGAPLRLGLDWERRPEERLLGLGLRHHPPLTRPGVTSSSAPTVATPVPTGRPRGSTRAGSHRATVRPCPGCCPAAATGCGAIRRATGPASTSPASGSRSLRAPPGSSTPPVPRRVVDDRLHARRRGADRRVGHPVGQPRLPRRADPAPARVRAPARAPGRQLRPGGGRRALHRRAHRGALRRPVVDGHRLARRPDEPRGGGVVARVGPAGARPRRRRNHVLLHERLVPYIRAAAATAHRTGQAWATPPSPSGRCRRPCGATPAWARPPSGWPTGPGSAGAPAAGSCPPGET